MEPKEPYIVRLDEVAGRGCVDTGVSAEWLCASSVLPRDCFKTNFLMMAGTHKKFWKRHSGLVWSNPEASDAVRIRAALLRPRFDRLLSIALEFGTGRVKAEWTELLNEQTDEARRAHESVTRILANIEKGVARAASGN